MSNLLSLYTGSIHVWAGGGPWPATPSPTATLTVPGAYPGDRLGFAQCHPLFVCDLTGDGLLDVVAIASLVDTTVVDAGAAYVWRGGALLAGEQAPWSALTVPTAVAEDRLAGWTIPP